VFVSSILNYSIRRCLLFLPINEETVDCIYELSDEQINAVEEAREQFKNGQFLKREQSDCPKKK